jgi:ubiquinone/menaquinone biosynthesis C-methylase UbiE
MQIEEAVLLIHKANIDKTNPSYWADLGCGNGVFTHALAKLLPAGSHIYAIDKTDQQIPPASHPAAGIEFIQADFEKEQMLLPPLHGIMMANSLHYIKDKEAFIKNLNGYFLDKSRFIIAEYDRVKSNRWVPYPIDISSLQKLFAGLGFIHFDLLGKRPSVYGQGNLYAAYVW